MFESNPRSTALILVDLQNGIVAMPLAPRPGSEVVDRAKSAAAEFRAAGALVVAVRVAWSSDVADAPSGAVDKPTPRPAGGLPPGWSDLAEGLEGLADLVVTKRHCGAFHGTELDLQLRRRGITTAVIAGIATNFGVEQTAREAWQCGYDVVVVEDLCTSISSDLHEASVLHVLPRIARVRRTDGLKLVTP